LTADRFVKEGDLGATFVGMVHSGSPSLHTALEDCSNVDGAASSVGGSSISPAPRGCNVVTPTIPMVMVRTTAPQPGMQLLLDQQQDY
jgi:hypothetical protein